MRKDLYVSSKKLVFTDVVPGTKCSNGGEYGEYTIYEPTKKEGLYGVWLVSTSDFEEDYFEGYEYLTKKEYSKLRKRSNDIEDKGSLY